MKRRFCFLLVLAAVFLAGPGGMSALMATDLGTEKPEVATAQSGDEQPETRQVDRERNAPGERRSRKSIGAEFWGGPYWGYGPRWGHPCEACRASCENDQEGSRCERCRVRCGW